MREPERLGRAQFVRAVLEPRQLLDLERRPAEPAPASRCPPLDEAAGGWSQVAQRGGCPARFPGCSPRTASARGRRGSRTALDRTPRSDTAPRLAPRRDSAGDRDFPRAKAGSGEPPNRGQSIRPSLWPAPWPSKNHDRLAASAAPDEEQMRRRLGRAAGMHGGGDDHAPLAAVPGRLAIAQLTPCEDRAANPQARHAAPSQSRPALRPRSAPGSKGPRAARGRGPGTRAGAS